MTLPYVDPRAPRGRLYGAFTRLLGTRVAGWLSRAGRQIPMLQLSSR